MCSRELWRLLTISMSHLDPHQDGSKTVIHLTGVLSRPTAREDPGWRAMGQARPVMSHITANSLVSRHSTWEVHQSAGSHFSRSLAIYSQSVKAVSFRAQPITPGKYTTPLLPNPHIHPLSLEPMTCYVIHTNGMGRWGFHLSFPARLLGSGAKWSEIRRG